MRKKLKLIEKRKVKTKTNIGGRNINGNKWNFKITGITFHCGSSIKNCKWIRIC